jgi:hypothetical protein
MTTTSTTTTSTLADRIRKIDVRHPETLDIFEIRTAVEKAIKDLDLPEVDLDRLDVLGLRDLISKLDLPEIDLGEMNAEFFDRFDVLGLRKAVVDADRVEFSMPNSPADVVSQFDDVRSSFESIVKNVFDNATDLAPVTRKELADLEKRVIAAEKAAKRSTAKKAPARKKPAAKKAAAKKA